MAAAAVVIVGRRRRRGRKAQEDREKGTGLMAPQSEEITAFYCWLDRPVVVRTVTAANGVPN
jgi:hypothetical protein